MEAKDIKMGNGKKARFPPRRGQIKAKMFRAVVKKVKILASMMGLQRKKGGGGGGAGGIGGGGGSSDSTKIPPIFYNCEGHSDFYKSLYKPS
ncbi:hypothetical protein HYC85_013949 [Camellia sinensis]|uniref:Uncharacterized protein n=1 Tax=Camellia sinensis TaxID=4442 RepID=A0A7J7H4U4_CAMSI|nr:hypothetical protein HYC85_013949 [Camellia sinensis]